MNESQFSKNMETTVKELQDDLTYEFGDELSWMRQKTNTFQTYGLEERSRHPDPYQAYCRAIYRSVYCYVYRGEELVQIINCTEWALNSHPEGNSQALKKFLESKLETTR